MITGMLSVGGCVSSGISRWSTERVLDAFSRRELADRERLEVLRELRSRQLDRAEKEELGRILAGVAGSPLHSPLLRGEVIPLIVKDYPEEGGTWLGNALNNTREEEIRRGIISALGNLNDRVAVSDLIMALENSYQISPGERDLLVETIEGIAGVEFRQVLIDNLLNGQSVRYRIAALACLKNQLSGDDLLATILELPEKDLLIQQLQFWAGRFGYVPGSFSRYVLCQWQGDQLTPAQFTKLSQRSDDLKSREEYTFDIQDSHLLLNTEAFQLMRSRAGLIQDIQNRLELLGHTKRPPSYPGASDDYPEGFVDQSNLLNYTDLLRITLLQESLARMEILEQIRTFLEDNQSEENSEVGGLIFLEKDGRLTYKKYTPGEHKGDNQYVESPNLILEAALCMSSTLR